MKKLFINGGASMKSVKPQPVEGKRINYNLGNWGKTENILIITGISGSGKTTLAREAGENMNAIIIPTDEWMPYDKNKKLESMRDLVTQEALDSLKATIETVKEDKDQLYIIEGILIYMLTREELEYTGVLGKPLIVVDTSINNIIEATRDKAIQRGGNYSYPYIFKDELVSRMDLMAKFLEELEKQS
jgi:shikimate kinase